MRIQNIQNLSYCASNPRKVAQKNVNPMKDGLTTAGAWFAFGVGLDLVSRKLQFSKSPIKNSLAINGIIGGGAGLFTGLMGLYKKPNEE